MIDLFNVDDILKLEKWANETQAAMQSLRIPYYIEVDNYDAYIAFDSYRDAAISLLESISYPLNQVTSTVDALYRRLEDMYCEIVEVEDMDFAEVWKEEIL